MERTKVFCVGFQKTGTTSLGRALEILGYRVCGYRPFSDLADHDGDDVWERVEQRAFALAEENDAFKDTPWPLLYREMDERHPGSKFILVTRDTDRWIKSATDDFKAWPNAMHRHIYGVPFPRGHEDVWVARYERHNREVREYFGDRPDFVHFHLNAGEVTWESLCGFLGHDVPDQPWPHENTKGDKRRRMLLQRIKGKLFGPSKR